MTGLLLVACPAVGAWGVGWLRSGSDSSEAAVAPLTAPMPSTKELVPIRQPLIVPPSIPRANQQPSEPQKNERAAIRSRQSRPGEDSTLVVEAIRSLRNDGDPARAERMLQQYRAKHPSGALVEDALAVSIEAAATSDAARAATLAREYLAKYPRGRYRKTAERALSTVQ
jgi:hypothetical protein